MFDAATVTSALLSIGALACAFSGESDPPVSYPGGNGSAEPAPLPGAKPPLLESASVVDVLAAVREPGMRAVVLNVWATWCMPCREEFPELLRIRRMYEERGVRVLFVSADFATERARVEAYLGAQGVDFKTFLKAGPIDPFIAGFDRRWNGIPPATFIFDRKGRRRESILGRAPRVKIEYMLHEILGGDGR